jgi:beta-glucanase (GH16 family)
MIVLGCLLIGMMVYIYRVNQSSQDNNHEKKQSKQDNFDVLDQSIWSVTDKNLGRTLLSSENVEVKDGYLNIRIPANTLEGGELVKQQAVTYGSYESRMKLPKAPSSITGFFLYAPPDYFYEIDIEIHNTNEGKLLLTTYEGGAVQNEYVGKLGFDPTADFHNYRFDYAVDGVAFYVDSKLILEWQDGFPVGQPLQLMVNTWYPNWLEGTPTPDDQVLLVDWIRY